MHLFINGKQHTIPAQWAQDPLLFFLREYLGLVGAKFGCGVGSCGACTVIIDGVAQRSCVVALEDAANARVRTIEGLAPDGQALNKVQQAWIDEAVPQCGYCQAGQIMSATALLEQNPNPSDDEIDAAMSGNLCRCGTYGRIRRAIIGIKGTES